MKLYGIANCDTVKQARAWLKARNVSCSFHDYKRDGAPAAQLPAWQEALGWEPLINRSGATWRRLSDPERAAVVDAASARSLMTAQSSVIRRPVVEWDDGHISVGFNADDWAAFLFLA